MLTQLKYPAKKNVCLGLKEFLESNAITREVLDSVNNESQFKDWDVHKWGDRCILLQHIKDLKDCYNYNQQPISYHHSQFETTEGFPQ